MCNWLYCFLVVQQRGKRVSQGGHLLGTESSVGEVPDGIQGTSVGGRFGYGGAQVVMIQIAVVQDEYWTDLGLKRMRVCGREYQNREEGVL